MSEFERAERSRQARDMAQQQEQYAKMDRPSQGVTDASCSGASNPNAIGGVLGGAEKMSVRDIARTQRMAIDKLIAADEYQHRTYVAGLRALLRALPQEMSPEAEDALYTMFLDAHAARRPR